MTTLSPDTHPEIERLQVERLRQMPAWRKVALMVAMGQTVRTLALAGLRQRHPDDTPAQRRRRLAAKSVQLHRPSRIDYLQRGVKHPQMRPMGRELH